MYFAVYIQRKRDLRRRAPSVEPLGFGVDEELEPQCLLRRRLRCTLFRSYEAAKAALQRTREALGADSPVWQDHVFRIEPAIPETAGKVVYLACPYSSPDPQVRRRRYEEARAAAARILRWGEVVYCPVLHSHDLAEACGLPTEFEFWRRQSLMLLARCDELYVLTIDGWQQSLGVAAETAEAKRLGIPIKYIP